VDIGRPNDAPYLVDCAPTNAGGGIWIIEGHVIDGDDDPTTVMIECSGLFSMRAVPDETGHFQFAVKLPLDAYGFDNVVAVDSHGSSSNTRIIEIGLT
jgi:hypothetical protein